MKMGPFSSMHLFACQLERFRRGEKRELSSETEKKVKGLWGVSQAPDEIGIGRE